MIIDQEHGILMESYISQSFHKEFLKVIPFHKKFLKVIHNAQMEQFVTFPTQGMNILDLCLTTHPSIISTYKPIPGLSDYDTVFINLSVSLHCIKITHIKSYFIKMQIGTQYTINSWTYQKNISNLMILLPEALMKIGIFSLSLHRSYK